MTGITGITQSIPDLLVNTAAEALGTMFFTPVTRRLKGSFVANTTDTLLVRIPFLAGSQSNGALDVRVSSEGAQWIASSFLASDGATVPEYRVNDVICELANVICGSLLSVMLTDRGFRLLTPEVLREKFPDQRPSSFEESLELERGWLTLRLNMSPAA